MRPEWICHKTSLLNERPCNHLNNSETCSACGGTRYLSQLIEFETRLKTENVALSKIQQNMREGAAN